jgi:hypothetical protein
MRAHRRTNERKHSGNQRARTEGSQVGLRFLPHPPPLPVFNSPRQALWSRGGRARARQPRALAAAAPGKARGARASCYASEQGQRDRARMSVEAGRAIRRDGVMSEKGRGFPRAMSWRAPGVVPLLGRVRVASGHICKARAAPRLRARRCAFVDPAAGTRGINLVGGGQKN